MNIISEADMLDLVIGYLGSQSSKPLFIGGCVGTVVFEHVLHTAINTIPFEQIKIVEGVQDVVAWHKDIRYNNHNFYAELFMNDFMTIPRDTSTIEGFFSREDNIRRYPKFNTSFNADLIIINDAHLIPDIYMNQILRGCNTKVICIVDPFDVDGDRYMDTPTVIDVLKKLPLLYVQARSLFDIESRGLDKSISSIVDYASIKPRSMGKIDDNIYVTSDNDMLVNARLKQYNQPFRKRHKIMMIDDYVVRDTFDPNKSFQPHEDAISMYSLLTILEGGDQKIYYRGQLYNSNRVMYIRPTYDKGPVAGNMHVVPANILSVEEAAHHRYKKIIFCQGNSQVTKRQMYSLLKNTRQLSLVE